jgi:hypothetical protein
MSRIPADTLLDPKNDYVFFRVFSEDPDLLVDLINVVRRDEPPITEVKLRKADRLGQLPERLSAWIAYFEHWREDTTMSTHTYPPVQRAIEKLRALSADEDARYWAEAREKALHDEATLLLEAREEGRQEGEQIGWQKAARETAGHLIELGLLNDVQIAQVTGLSLAQIEALRANRTP